MSHIGYSMTAEVKILRRKHTVCFRVGQTSKSLIEALDNVPDDATVDEVLEDDGNGVASIEFHEEIVNE